jgi:hypothetical protein
MADLQLTSVLIQTDHSYLLFRVRSYSHLEKGFFHSDFSVSHICSEFLLMLGKIIFSFIEWVYLTKVSVDVEENFSHVLLWY